MRVLVTGGAGFIGSHLVDRLIMSGAEVISLDSLVSGKIENVHKDAEFIQGDVLDSPLLASLFKRIDLCYHLAAIPSVQESTERWLDCHNVNLGGSINVFEVASRYNIPVIYASSAAVYGNSAELPLRESAPIKPLSPYGFDKYCSEVQAGLFAKFKGLKSVGLRFFNVYGTRQDPQSPYSGVLSIFANQIANNQSIKIFGDGTQERDFIFVQDVVEALMRANDESALQNAEIFNVCTNVGTSVFQLAETIADVMRLRTTIEYLPMRDGDIYKSLGSDEKISEILGFKASIPLKNGLKAMFGNV